MEMSIHTISHAIYPYCFALHKSLKNYVLIRLFLTPANSNVKAQAQRNKGESPIKSFTITFSLISSIIERSDKYQQFADVVLSFLSRRALFVYADSMLVQCKIHATRKRIRNLVQLFARRWGEW